MKVLIITNNPAVHIEYCNAETVDFQEDADQEAILRRARDRIHLGSVLVMHPMMGRIKPHETPYKSVLLTEGGGETDLTSVQIIEESIAETSKFLGAGFRKKYDDSLLPDLQLIDLWLLKSGIEEYRR